MLVAMAAAAAGYVLLALGLRDAAAALRAFLLSGGWLWLPMMGAVIGAASALRDPMPPRSRRALLIWALAVALSPLVLRPVVPPEPAAAPPRTQRDKFRAFRRWSYRSPRDVARILRYVYDPDPVVREQAALALGLNTLVTDIEHATPGNPARYLAHPVRDSLRAALLSLMLDPVEPVRGEAARALWKSPRAFGTQPAAAETLAAILDRALLPQAVERMAWLALDAAAGAPHPALKAAAARFAAASPDTELARVAREVVSSPASAR